MAFFTEVEQKFLDVFETQKPPNRHSNLKKEKWSWKDQALVPNYTTKWQSSKKYSIGIKTENRSMDGRSRNNPHTYGQFICTQKARLYNGENTVSSISDAGETR